MIQVAPGTKVHLACRPVSMRYGFDGLSAVVAAVLALDPVLGSFVPLPRAGSGGATFRRQSIASTRSASCAGVSTRAPSTIGGHTNQPAPAASRTYRAPEPSH
jgi:hypothetical protein